MGCPDKRHYPTRADAVGAAAKRAMCADSVPMLRIYECGCGKGFCLTKQPERPHVPVKPNAAPAYPAQ